MSSPSTESIRRSVDIIYRRGLFSVRDWIRDTLRQLSEDGFQGPAVYGPALILYKSHLATGEILHHLYENLSSATDLMQDSERAIFRRAIVDILNEREIYKQRNNGLEALFKFGELAAYTEFGEALVVLAKKSRFVRTQNASVNISSVEMAVRCLKKGKYQPSICTDFALAMSDSIPALPSALPSVFSLLMANRPDDPIANVAKMAAGINAYVAFSEENYNKAEEARQALVKIIRMYTSVRLEDCPKTCLESVKVHGLLWILSGVPNSHSELDGAATIPNVSEVRRKIVLIGREFLSVINHENLGIVKREITKAHDNNAIADTGRLDTGLKPETVPQGLVV